MPRVEALARELGEERESLLTCARRSARELEAMDLSSLSVTVVHADYRMANLLFDGDRVTAVFDFSTWHSKHRACWTWLDESDAI